MREIVTDPEYVELTGQLLIELNEAMNVIADREGKPLAELFPTFPKWSMKEVQLVKEDLTAKDVWVELRRFADLAEPKALVFRRFASNAEQPRPIECLQSDGSWRKVGEFSLIQDSDRIDVNDPA